jgi:iron complex outermembrane recepter protein
MKRLFFICFLLLYFTGLKAQNRIFGKITDQDKRPLTGASVFVPELSKGSLSDAKGNFELKQLPRGKFRVQFSYVGYANRIEVVELRGQDVEMNIQMELTVIEAEELVVSGGYNSTQHENAVKIDVLKTDDHKLLVSPSFMDVLTRLPGVSMISKGSGIGKPVIRGLSMNDVLILNNGVRFENYQYSAHHPLGIDEAGISSVEVIRGPASLLYGSDAIGGVINFIREKPAPAGTMSGDYRMQLHSNTMGISNNLGIKGSSGKFFGGFRAGYKSHADFLQGGGDFAPNTRFSEISFKTTAGYTGKRGTAALYYDYGMQLQGLAEEEAVEEISKRGRKNQIFLQEFNTHLVSSQNKIYFGRMKLDLNAAYQNTVLAHAEHEDEYEIEMELATLSYEARLHLPSGLKSEYILGFQGYHQENRNLNQREVKLLPDASTLATGFYGLFQHEFFGSVKFQAGLRYDMKDILSQAVGDIADSMTYRAPLERNYGSFSGSAGLTWAISPDLLLRANYAAAYRTPNLAELTSKGVHELRFEAGNSGLRPENSQEADISAHYHSSHISFDLAAFFNRIDSYIFLSPTSDTTAEGISIYRFMQSDAKLIGGEAGIHIHPKSLEWLHFETTFSMVQGMLDDGSYLPFIPAHELHYEIRLEKEKMGFLRDAFVLLGANTVFAQNQTAADETPSPAYSLFDFSTGAGIKINRQTALITLGVRNLLDKKYSDHLSTLREAGLFNPGRNIYLSLKIPFGIKN